MLETNGPTGLLLSLQQARPLADELLNERLTNLTDGHEGLHEGAQIIAARPSSQWRASIDIAASALGVDRDVVTRVVAQRASDFNRERRSIVSQQLNGTTRVRVRLESISTGPPADRWASLARRVDTRLLTQPDWPATAQMLQEVHDSGQDPIALTVRLVEEEPLGVTPAQELRYRLIGYIPDATQTTTSSSMTAPPPRHTSDKQVPRTVHPLDGGRRR